MTIRRALRNRQVAEVIMRAADDGEFLTVTGIYERLPYTCAYGSMRKMLKKFEDEGLITKKRTGMSVTIMPNPALYAWFRN